MSGEAEQDKCDFCHEIKTVGRTYLRPSKYIKPDTLEERNKLYNQGGYFVIVKTCSDCGEPKDDLQKPIDKANLGMAKTSELIYELSARCDTGSINKGGDYKTVDNN